ncbi:MAG: hypothetical protein C4548_08665 [Desulfobacteraceae bacterium]|nr:MAG: hypothetical protein C4548_08665 [Desulfobacteraceae bacterium]
MIYLIKNYSRTTSRLLYVRDTFTFIRIHVSDGYYFYLLKHASHDETVYRPCGSCFHIHCLINNNLKEDL